MAHRSILTLLNFLQVKIIQTPIRDYSEHVSSSNEARIEIENIKKKIFISFTKSFSIQLSPSHEWESCISLAFQVIMWLKRLNIQNDTDATTHRPNMFHAQELINEW